MSSTARLDAPGVSSSVLVLKHLEEVVTSAAFAPSKRSQEFLRFVVHKTLNGEGDSIKERLIATEAFGRRPDYDPREDSIVRVKATEVRKRLAQFYEGDGANSPIRIELAVGSYVPKLHVRQNPEEAPPVKNRLLTRRRAILAGSGLLSVIGAAGVGFRYLGHDVIRMLWEPVVDSVEPLAIFLAILEDSTQPGVPSDRVGVGSSYGAVQVASLMTRRNHPFVVKLGSDLNFADLRRQPSFLFGAFSSNWPSEIVRGKPFELAQHSSSHGDMIVDTKTGRTFTASNLRSNGYADYDYALAARIFDAENGQVTMLASGITTFGCQTAAELMVNGTFFNSALKHAPKDWAKRSFQILLHTKIVGHTPGPPTVVDTVFW